MKRRIIAAGVVLAGQWAVMLPVLVRLATNLAGRR